MTAAQDYEVAKRLARKIAATYAPPRFFSDLSREIAISGRKLRTDPILRKSCIIVEERDENIGHGVRHFKKVATDAGAIVQNESARMGSSDDETERAVFLVQLAAILHDVRRRVKNHAMESAKAAADIIQDFPLKTVEKEWIVQSIGNHEAFTEPTEIASPEGQILSDALYDADKFRWGPDNFTDTLWEMVSPRDVPIRLLLAHFPKGTEGVERIAGTFRSDTGKEYGPEFIEIGLSIGRSLYDELMKRFPPDEGE